MEYSSIEASYPLNFRAIDCEELGQNLKNRQSMVLIGMKRVGISNFLRFFLNHPKVKSTYIGDSKNHLFIPVDLNDLVERELYPFWTLTLKRIADATQDSALPDPIKKQVADLFLEAIQSQDLFFTIDCIRKSLSKIIENNFLPTLFFIRFDRIKDALTPEFFTNLQSLRESTQHTLCFVFTSFRSLNDLTELFQTSPISPFTKDLYIKPAKYDDLNIIFKSYEDRYQLNLSPDLETELFRLVDGYAQYLQLALVILHENTNQLKSPKEIFETLSKDERMMMQSEELWESLNPKEQSTLESIIAGKEISEKEKLESEYLWDTGFISEDNQIFSPLFETYIQNKSKFQAGEKAATKKTDNGVVELSKKENLLFTLLKNNENNICEREHIIENVWPETESLGISDWAIDRLIARVRSKLKSQKSPYEIVTIKTRGYKLISNHPKN